MATMIAARDKRQIKQDCSYLQIHAGFKGESRFVCSCVFKLKPDSCTGCEEYKVASSGLSLHAEQAELFESQVIQYQLSVSARDEAEKERIRVSEWLVNFFENVPRDAKGKKRVETAHHAVSLVEPTASTQWNIEKVRDLFKKVGGNVIKRRMNFEVEIPEGIEAETVNAAISRALKRVSGELTFTSGALKEEVSQDAINAALELELVTAEELKPACDVTYKKAYPKVDDQKEARPKEAMI